MKEILILLLTLIVAIATIIFIKPVNERFTGLFRKKIYQEEKIKISYDIKRIQSLLRKAGFYKAAIDGKVGPETIRAIKQFQRSKKIEESGVLNVKTWEELKKFETGS